MRVQRLEHYNIRTTKFTATVEFYKAVLGMEAKSPPIMCFDGLPTWLYDDSGVAAIHLTPVDPIEPFESYARIIEYRGGEPDVAFEGSGAIDHVAFACEGLEEMRARLKSLKVKFAENHVPSLDLHQIFLKDPNGITLELNFH